MAGEMPVRNLLLCPRNYRNYQAGGFDLHVEKTTPPHRHLKPVLARTAEIARGVEPERNPCCVGARLGFGIAGSKMPLIMPLAEERASGSRQPDHCLRWMPTGKERNFTSDLQDAHSPEAPVLIR
jgi:hypothetical protein